MSRTSRIWVARGNWWVWGAAVVVLLMAGGEARAFYWYGWPGSQALVEQTLVPTTSVPTPPPGPLVVVDKPPEQTPEPATGLLGLLGLGAVAAVKRWRSAVGRKS